MYHKNIRYKYKLRTLLTFALLGIVRFMLIGDIFYVYMALGYLYYYLTAIEVSPEDTGKINLYRTTEHNKRETLCTIWKTYYIMLWFWQRYIEISQLNR